jgi:hypothetical protein
MLPAPACAARCADGPTVPVVVWSAANTEALQALDSSPLVSRMGTPAAGRLRLCDGPQQSWGMLANHLNGINRIISDREVSWGDMPRMFKYDAELKQVATAKVPCPPASATDMNGSAWRWVTKPITETCFDPAAIKNPPRLLKAQTAGSAQECSCWGLSMHKTQAQSVTAFQELEKSIRNARKIFGGHVSGALLTAVHGKGTKPTAHGHFDLHPYKAANFLALFVTCQVIP